MLEHVLVAFDGSEGAGRALAFARKAVGSTGRLTVVRVVEPPVPYVVGGFDGVVTLGEMPTEADLDTLRTQLETHLAGFGGRANARIELGHPVEVICMLAEELSPDLVVTGARGLGGVARFLVGSVSDRIVHHCPKPVAVVR